MKLPLDKTEGPQFNLYYKSKNQKPKLFYDAKALFNLIASCIQNDKGDYLFLFEEANGGNAGPEDLKESLKL
jgi:hypothetical protein